MNHDASLTNPNLVSGTAPPKDDPKPHCENLSNKPLLTVREAAKLLNISESWVRRHTSELPVVRTGRLLRIDSALLVQQFSGKMHSGKSLKPERKLMLSPYQRGSVVLKGRKKKIWYGIFRQDVMNSEGQIERRQKKVRLGTLNELPTKNAARDELAALMRDSKTSSEMTFEELTERWEAAEGVTMKPTTLSHYRNALHAYVLPKFGKRKIFEINREDVQLFLKEQSHHYSESSLRSMRLVLGRTLGWAKDCRFLEDNPCSRIKLPKRTGGRKVNRTVLTPDQVTAIAGKIEEPYATLVLFLAATGVRIGEAIAIRWSNVVDNVVHIRRRIYDGDEDTVKSKASDRKLPVDPNLFARMKALGNGEWVFKSKAGTPVNPGNALKRYVRPAAKELNIPLGGWHDFRHTITTTMRRNGVHPRVVSSILGHAKVNLAMDTYDRATAEDFVQPLAKIAGELLPSCDQKHIAEGARC